MADSRKMPWTLWTGVALVLVTLGLCLLVRRSGASGAVVASLPVISPVADFTLTNQAGQAVTLANLTNHVWVADIIFTRCPGPCPRMSRQMKSLQDLLPPASDARLVTLTTDPEFDTPAVLAGYAARYQADTNRWMFLTGTKEAVAGLAAGSLKLSSQPVKPEYRQGAFDLFIHTTMFVLVDQHARLRGVYETGGDGVDWPAVQKQLKDAIAQLEAGP